LAGWDVFKGELVKNWPMIGVLTIEHAWSRDYAASSVTAVLPPPGQRCGTVCLNSFGNRTSPLDNLKYR